MNLNEIRAAVRTQMDLDEDDLPNATLDLYVREAYDRTIQMERRWPFFETSWSLTSNADSTLTTPADLAGIVSVIDVELNRRLLMIGAELAEDTFQGEQGTGTPEFFSVWGTSIQLWPSHDAPRQYRIRGWRKPSDWVSAGASTEVDADERLHIPIFHYACSLAYAQLEDPELESSYMRRWAATAEQAHEDIMRPQHHEPLVLNGGTRVRGRRYRFVWDI